ncbi:hypothetical protein [Iamia sp.]|uniref:hypothetical protein n=1 Tax=Iamia sp. TaxID=2722710 RepID=UPI002D0D67D1|nr:hypothetical protein [Iamia sp.]HXH59090.1 hypothetical protein [Iamia sp.]
MSERATHLRVDQVRALDHFCHLLKVTFDETPYLVGSVDVRIPIDDEAFEVIPMDVLDLNMLLSRWGQQVTGLPIDCQAQRLSEFRDAKGPARPRTLPRRTP